jgi:virginiamycin B lyase
MSIRFSSLGAILLACAALLPLPDARATEIREWPVPWENTRPRDPSVAPDGRVWFVGQTGNYLAVFDPTTQKFDRYDLPPRTAPHTVVVDTEGQPWVAGNGNGTVLRYGPDGTLRQTYAVPEHPLLNVRDPHTIAFDGKGGLWFTMQAGNAIAHLDVKSGAIRVARVASADARPYGIVATPDGNAWAVLFGTNKLARIERDGMKITEVELPRAACAPAPPRPRCQGRGLVRRLRRGLPRPARSRHGQDRGMARALEAVGAVCHGDRRQGPHTVLRDHAEPEPAADLRPRDQAVRYATPVQTKGEGAVRHMEFDAKRNSLWFGTDRNTLGQAKLE